MTTLSFSFSGQNGEIGIRRRKLVSTANPVPVSSVFEEILCSNFELLHL